MRTHVLRGSKQEIVESLASFSGEVREAIVFVDEPTGAAGTEVADADDIFDEMRSLMVDVPDVDDSRQAIYTPMDGE
jgi:hypothetical protein